MSPIEHRKGDLLSADAEALVNTVNTVGVMGKGVALQFKKAFPDNYRVYRQACEAGEVVPGKMFVFETGQLAGPRLIVNFPTKRHWKGKARMADIEEGLVDLVQVLRKFEVASIAVPPLGCGQGGLEWSEVQPRIEGALAGVGAKVLLFVPGPPPPARLQRSRTARPPMTRVRASLLAAFGAYRVDPSVTLTRLVAQKLAYLVQVEGEPLGLDFVKGDFGPYAETLNFVLQDLEGHYVEGYGDRTGPTDIRLLGDTGAEAQAFLARDPAAGERVARVRTLIDGLESPFGLELLTTVHWAVVQDGARSPNEALQVIGEWTPRKQKVFQERHVAIAWERLHDQGWLGGSLPEQLTL